MSRILHHVGRNDFKKTRQRQIGEQKERAAQKLKESQEAEAKRKQRKQIEEAARPYKSNWREETQLQESDWRPLSGSIANSTSQTFVHATGATTTISGLGGVETTPSTVTINAFGDIFDVPGPEYGQYGMQGYAPKLNPKYAEAQEKYKKELSEWEKRRDENFVKMKDTLKSFGTSFEELRASKDWVKKLGDGTFVALMPTSPNADLMNWTDNVRVVKLKQAANADPMYIDYNTKEIDPLTGKKRPWMAHNVEIQNDVHLGVGERPKPPMEQEYLMPRRTDFKDVNPQLDASQEFAQNVDSDYMMNARVTDTPDAPSFNYDPAKTPFGSDYGEVSQVIDGEELLPQRIQDILKKGRNRAARKGINTELLNNYQKPEVQDVLQHRPELHDMYLRHMIGGAGGGYVPGGGMIDPSALANAAAAAGSNVSDFVRGLPQPGDAGYVNPTIIGRLARSATDNIRYAPGGQMITGLPSGVNYDPNFRSNMKLQRAVPGRNYGTPLQTMGRGELNVGRMYQDTNQLTRGTPFGNKSGTYNVQPTPTKGMRGVKNPFGSVVNRGWSGTPEIQIPKGGPQAVRSSADDLARAAAKSSTKASRFLSRFIPGANAVLAGADVAQRSSQGDYFGAALGAASAFPGPPGWAALGLQMGYDALGRPFKGSPSNVTPTSGRGAGRSSFSTSDGNVVPKANKGFAPDPKTGEPRYTGMNDRQYSDATNKIVDKYNKLRAPIERQYAEYAGRVAPMSLMNKINALNDAQTAEENALAAARAAQENAFNDALQDYNNKQNAESEARAKAIDELDNEKDPHSDTLSNLYAALEKLKQEGKLIKGYKVLGPGDEGYTDYSKIGGALGGNRKPIYTAAANKLQKQIEAAQKASDSWQDAQQKKRNALGGQGGLPLGTTTNRSGGAMGSKSQASSLASQAASAGMNPQQRRKRGIKESTWDRINKYR